VLDTTMRKQTQKKTYKQPTNAFYFILRITL
jgi:hypothetical protein